MSTDVLNVFVVGRDIIEITVFSMVEDVELSDDEVSTSKLSDDESSDDDDEDA